MSTPLSAQRPCEGWKDPHVQLVSWGLQGGPELTALPGRGEAAGEGDHQGGLDSRGSTARKANAPESENKYTRMPGPARGAPAVRSSPPTHLLLPGCRAPGQKARRAPRAGWGARRAPPKSEAPERTVMPSSSVTWPGSPSHVSNWAKSSLMSGATCRAALAASVIALRYIPFFLRLNLSLKNSQKGASLDTDKNDVVGEPNHETFASCQEGSPSSFWLRLMSSTRAGHQGKP